MGALVLSATFVAFYKNWHTNDPVFPDYKGKE
jgi:hypothetical protein